MSMKRSDGTNINDNETQRQRALDFRQMHVVGPLLQIVNAWDSVSARVAAAAGASAIGTTSFGIALAHGVQDGENLEWPEMRAVVMGVSTAVGVPVTVDLEAGRGATPSD